MDIEATFNEAADLVARKGPSSGLSDNLLLQLYGLYKVATVGPCMEKQPSVFNMKAKSKWSAWKESSSLGVHDAMNKYVELVKGCLGWEPEKAASNDDQNEDYSQQHPTNSFMMGNSVSSFVIPDDGNDEQESNPVFTWAKNCDLVKLKEWVEQDDSNVDVTDSNGLTLLHWAVDRGHISACKLLLDSGANCMLMDNDGLTCLEYAETCEHEEIVVLLKASMIR